MSFDVYTGDQSGALYMWTVYEKPRDFPDQFVARMFATIKSQQFASDQFITADTLEELRAQLPRGLVCLARAPQDDPMIVETWL